MERDSTGIVIYTRSPGGLITFCTSESNTVPTTADKFDDGCLLITPNGTLYTNGGTSAVPSFQNVNNISTAEIADGAVTPAKTAQTEEVTATADGLTTGIVTATARHITITSASADNIVTLPASVVGKQITGYVGANGCELRTTASSGIKINGVDSDGTNEAAIPDTTLIKLTCVASDEWILEAITELGAVVTAIIPDTA